MYINSVYGGGIVMLRGNCDGSVFRNCAWIGNNSVYSKEGSSFDDPEGGALVVRLGAAEQVARVENCTFAWNFYSGKNSTAGVNVRAGTLAMTNSVVWGNACGTQLGVRPADIYVQAGATALVGYSRLSAPSECLADDGGTLTIGAGCTFGDPLLVTSTNSLSAYRTHGAAIKFTEDAGEPISSFNAHLRGGAGYVDEKTGELVTEYRRPGKSPAIDAGDPASDYSHEAERDRTGTNGKRVNMGYYGNTPWATMTMLGGNIIRLR